MKNIFLYSILSFGLIGAIPLAGNAQTAPVKPDTSIENSKNDTTKKSTKKEPKKFSEFIKADVKEDKGLFTIYFQEDKYFFEVADSILNRDILVVNRISRSGTDLRTGMSGYGGDQINENVIRFEKGPKNNIFLRNISFSERSKDTTQAMFRSVMNSNVQPIAAAFDIVAHGKNKGSSIIDMTPFIEGDNNIFFFSPSYKANLRLGAIKKEKSYIEKVSSFPQNTEIKTVKTYARTAPIGVTGPAAAIAAAGNATLELNTSIVLLPKVPMQGRQFDPRVGYFTVRYTDFDINPQGVKRNALITRWRLEPKAEDMEKYKRGELVEPKKPIVFYIDPATPEKWVDYLIAGVNDWQSAFEEAGFKNAIVGKRAPTPQEDPEWSLEDARYSAIVYKPSSIPNASGPHVNDPRSGEILESHINWYHSVMTLLRNWYFIQASPNDERARKMEFEDELMGDLIRFVSSHEVGHTLGLRHNFGASSAYPVEKLRDAKWVKEHGVAASIMDYARFNYIAQPGDGITGADLYPRINYYDKWAIEWGYKLIPEAKSDEAERTTLNQWILAKADDPKYWFGTESNPDDPRSQSEDLGDDSMLASHYGILNLQRIMPNLESWTATNNEGYDNLKELYGELITQYNRYAGHVTKNIAGIYETPKTVEQKGAVYELVPAKKQQRAIDFLNKEVFTTPEWLINYEISNKIGEDPIPRIGSVQNGVVGRLLSARTIDKLIKAETQDNKAFGVKNLFDGLNKGIWDKLNTESDVYKRNLQKHYVASLIQLLTAPTETRTAFGQPVVDPTQSDVSSIARAELDKLQQKIRESSQKTKGLTSYHLQDLDQRINRALYPEG